VSDDEGGPRSSSEGSFVFVVKFRIGDSFLQRQAVPIAIGIAYFFYIELVEMWLEKSDKTTSVSQSETTTNSNFHPFNSTPQLSFLKISTKPPLTDYYFLNLYVKFKILA
jgi:hypothetical protein